LTQSVKSLVANGFVYDARKIGRFSRREKFRGRFFKFNDNSGKEKPPKNQLI
jgi:hypothetical protein